MLSRRIRGAAASGFQPVQLRKIGSPTAGASVQNTILPSAAIPASPVSQPAPPIVDEQLARLQSRVLELEGMLEQQVLQAQFAYQEGERAGRSQAETQLQPVLDRMAHAIDEVRNLKHKLREEAESDLVRLSLAIARKVIHRELSADPDSIAGLIRVALERLNVREILKIRVYPAHQKNLEQLLAQFHPRTPVEICPDTQLEPGGLVIETVRGDFDVSVDTNLREIELGLTDRLREQ